MNYLLSLDIGTTSVKGVLFDSSGNEHATALQEYDLETPGPDVVELDPRIYWSATREVIGGLIKESGCKPEDILSVGVTSQGETLIVVDENGDPLRPAIVWLDNRSGEEATTIGGAFDADGIYRSTGQNEVVPTWPATKILWLRKNEPESFRRAHKHLMVEDYVLYKLTGSFISDAALNPSCLYFDIETNCWWPEMLEFLGISEAQLPELVYSGEYTFPVSASASEETGLSARTVVTTAPIDQIAGAIGAGNIESGIVTETTGAALAVCASFNRPVYDPHKHIPCHTHGVRDKYMLLAWVATAGMAFRWYRDAFGGGKDYATLCEEAKSVPPGAEGLVFLPYLAGAGCPDFAPTAKGMFTGITLSHGQPHFTRSILESVAFLLRRNLEYLETLGVEKTEIRSLGGGARSDLWLQIKADMINKPVVTMACEESTCLGVAMLSGVATGIYRDLSEAREAMVHTRGRFEPGPNRHREYETVYREYCRRHDGAMKMVRGS